jgi:hypothetical protein
MTQIDAADECDVTRRLVRMPDHDQLLVVRSAYSHPLIEEHLATGSFDRIAEVLVLLLAVSELVEV